MKKKKKKHRLETAYYSRSGSNISTLISLTKNELVMVSCSAYLVINTSSLDFRYKYVTVTADVLIIRSVIELKSFSFIYS